MQGGVQRIGSRPPDETGHDYADRLRCELRGLWENVIERRAPGLLAHLSGQGDALPADADGRPAFRR